MFAKKNVVAAAALTMLAVAAQAQVSVYGTLDVSVGRKQELTTVPAGSTTYDRESRTTVDSSDMSQSYIGFKGQEDLGGGLKAMFKLESDLAVDTGAANTSFFWSRNATVGLAGDFGALDLGRFQSLAKLEAEAFNPFGSSATFSPTFRAAGNRTVNGVPDSNPVLNTGSWSNGINYVSPNMGGLTLSGQYSAKEAGKATAIAYSGGAYAVSANYTAGPLGLSVVYSDVKSVNSVAATDKTRGVLAGVSFDFGVVKLYSQYGNNKTTTFNTVGSDKGELFQIGVGIPVTADGTVLISAAQGKQKDSGRAGTEGSDKIRDISVGYTHKLSKRTNVYAALNNERSTFGRNTAPDEKGTTNSFAVGVRHAF